MMGSASGCSSGWQNRGQNASVQADKRVDAVRDDTEVFTS